VPEIEAELNLIEGIPLLAHYGVQLLPVQGTLQYSVQIYLSSFNLFAVRMAKHKLDLIKEVLKCEPSAYSKPQKLIDLVMLLSYSKDTAAKKETKGRVLKLLAEKAFEVSIDNAHSK
jgi:hypothetical protein